ncbi:unnamed protein product [Mytilus edulis]|uniref:Farnesoic acid O-methyl transferase domain-containing protein n=1 Tax=Mytilus edulis TaxID=6550 RepID=A0A8S3PUJ1_MYTED|nr:unnamed protein product [Mytilus edulis]
MRPRSQSNTEVEHCGCVIVEFSFSTTTIGNQVHTAGTPDILNLTEHLEKYGIEGSKITSFKFQVKASKDANVFLSSSTTMDSTMPFYDVNLGAHDNTKTQLVRRLDDSLSTTPFTKEWKAGFDRHRLKNTEFRDFWVSWYGGIIKHGRGPVVGDDIIGEWADPNPFPVKSIGVLNSFNTQGDWIIHVTVGAPLEVVVDSAETAEEGGFT